MQVMVLKIIIFQANDHFTKKKKSHYIFLLLCTNASFKIAIKCLLGMVENLPAMRETWVQSLGQEDPLEKGMATH